MGHFKGNCVWKCAVCVQTQSSTFESFNHLLMIGYEKTHSEWIKNLFIRCIYLHGLPHYTPTLVPTELCWISENYAISHAIVDRETAFVKQRLELRTTTKFLAFHQRIRHFEYFRAVCCFPLKKKKWLSFISLRELYHVFVRCQACDRRCFWILISCLIMLITSINCWAPFTTTNRHPVWILSAGDDNNNMSKDNM